jgi:hypothetical protein
MERDEENFDLNPNSQDFLIKNLTSLPRERAKFNSSQR